MPQLAPIHIHILVVIQLSSAFFNSCREVALVLFKFFFSPICWYCTPLPSVLKAIESPRRVLLLASVVHHSLGEARQRYAWISNHTCSSKTLSVFVPRVVIDLHWYQFLEGVSDPNFFNMYLGRVLSPAGLLVLYALRPARMPDHG